MRPHTLLALLVFLLLWGVGPVLAVTWQPGPRSSPVSGPREVYPLAIRSQAEIRQASEIRRAATSHRGRPVQTLGPPPREAPRLAWPDLLSLLMSWQC